MTGKAAWYSISSHVHHVCTTCRTGNNILKENRRTGTGSKPLCVECRHQIGEGRCQGTSETRGA